LENEFIHRQLFEDYANYKEEFVSSKFITHSLLKTLIEKLPKNLFTVTELGKSVEGRSIFSIKIGNGAKKVLAWSQMHGNENTATMALLDIFNFLSADDSFNDFRKTIFSELTLYFVPMLNPDGADKYQRENAIGIDLNRDAIRLVSPEAKILKKLYQQIQPDFSFNLHDQENKHTTGKSINSAAISFLAPPFNYEREINTVRRKTMQVIGYIKNVLSEFIPGHIGRYSDEYEPRAFGDNFVKWGTSSILIETGGWKYDNNKLFRRKLNFTAILAGLNSIATKNYELQSIKNYRDIPENMKHLFDVLLKNLFYIVNDEQFKIDIGITLIEKLDTAANSFYYVSKIEEIGDLTGFAGYSEIDCTGMFVEPGKISNDSYSFDNQLTKTQLLNFYNDGITYLKTDLINSAFSYSKQGINFTTNPSLQNKLSVGVPANFIIKKENNEIRFTILNGFVYDVQQQKGVVKNGIIV